jgi:hypothetical protein
MGEPSTIFTDRAEAQRLMMSLNDRQRGRYCPVIRGACNLDCVCLEPTRLIHQGESYTVTAPYCRHPDVQGHTCIYIIGE